MNKHSYNMGVIGNCKYLALVDDRASIKWMCWPDFDSSFIFGSLLDEEKGGYFSINPYNEYHKTRQYYVQNSNVLCTEFENGDSAFRVMDFAPRFAQYDRYFKPLMLIRRIEPIKGSPKVSVSCKPVGDYGRLQPEEYIGSNHIRYLGLEKQVRLTSNIPLSFIRQERPFVINEKKYLILTWGIPLEGPVESTSEDFLRKTILYWQEWVKRCTIERFWQHEVIRSALVLKLHQFEDTGAIIASSTTSLPEHDQSGRTWDYRYCWMRDSYYTLKALNDLSHFEELEAYSSYILNIAISDQDHYRPVYSIHGDEDFAEYELDLAGYKGNKPVRIGNQAREHIQNDVYGQILVSLLPLYIDKRLIRVERSHIHNLILYLLKSIERTMDETDAGLWEFRNISQKHCYTFLFHWAGSSAAIRIAKQLKDEKMLKLAQKLKKESARQIEACYHPEMKAYAQAIGSSNMDASQLKLITMQYLDPYSEKAREHLKVLEKRLKTDNGLFYRYRHEDDFGETKSAFLVCAFWYVEALACVGRTDEAMEHMEHLIKYSNHLNLFSEDIDPKTGSQWGNYPQTYSHVGLLNAAFRIARKVDKPDFI